MSKKTLITLPPNQDEHFDLKIRHAVQECIEQGLPDFDAVLARIGATDPRKVASIYEELLSKIPKEKNGEQSFKIRRAAAARARRAAAELPLRLPAGDPMHSQWWFTLETIAKLGLLTASLARGKPVAFLGTPTVGHYYSHFTQSKCTVFDFDGDVLQAIALSEQAEAISYNVTEEIGASYRNAFEVVVTDPPWYPETFELFIARAQQMVAPQGHILVAMPQEMTRPSIAGERRTLISNLIQAGYSIISLDSKFVSYRVPTFEAIAYNDLKVFHNRNWRHGDLLIIRNTSISPAAPPPQLTLPALDSMASPRREIFARNARQARFFLDPAKENTHQVSDIEPISLFGSTVSIRGIEVEKISVWGSNKKAISTRQISEVRLALQHWQNGLSAEETIVRLGSTSAQTVVTALQKHLGLWQEDHSRKQRKTTDELRKIRTSSLNILAAQPSKRSHKFESDGFRLDFQRDRDRVLWSQSFRKLADKTQLFPVAGNEQLRRRLTHSIEVMQLASTIATSFALDRDLTEAGALVHDVGHTPFGHAGEHALNNVIDVIDDKLGGFNHYEHGMDVVRYLESVYLSPGVDGFHGLNLTLETEECIIKHTYNVKSGSQALPTLLKASKHRDIPAGFCHLEGQAVRIADKISYLISDLEDGIRMGAFNLEDLATCRLFQRPPIDLTADLGEAPAERFISQRRAILKVLMEDILTASEARLQTVSSYSDVRKHSELIIGYSEWMADDVTEVWQRMQRQKLHSHPAVVAENLNASRIVRDLFLLYSAVPELIDPAFHKMHAQLEKTAYMEWYQKQTQAAEIGVPKRLLPYDTALGRKFSSQGDNWKIPLRNLIMAKDYVASLSDSKARSEYRCHVLTAE